MACRRQAVPNQHKEVPLVHGGVGNEEEHHDAQLTMNGIAAKEEPLEPVWSCRGIGDWKWRKKRKRRYGGEEDNIREGE